MEDKNWLKGFEYRKYIPLVRLWYPKVLPPYRLPVKVVFEKEASLESVSVSNRVNIGTMSVSDPVLTITVDGEKCKGFYDLEFTGWDGVTPLPVVSSSIHDDYGVFVLDLKDKFHAGIYVYYGGEMSQEAMEVKEALEVLSALSGLESEDTLVGNDG